MAKHLSEEERRFIIDLAQNGYAVKEIVSITERSPSAVHEVLNSAGIKAVKKYPQKQPTLTEKRKVIVDLRKQNLSYREIANRLGVNRHYVLEVSRMFGLDGVRGQKKDWGNPNDYLHKYNPNLEYVSGWKSVDEYAVIRFKDCGHEYECSMKTVRSHPEYRCKICADIKQREETHQRNMERIAERNRRLREKQEAKEQEFWNRPFEQTTWKTCPVCGDIFIGRKTYCSDRCMTQNKWHMKDGYRYLFPLEEVYERDNGICYLCGEQCDWNDYEERDGVIVYGNKYPSRDHVIPKSKGGTNTWDNIRLAHRLCNSKKFVN